MRAKHQRKTRRRADRLIAISEIEAHAASGEGVDVRRAGRGVTVTTQGRLEVVHQDEEDVGVRGFVFRREERC